MAHFFISNHKITQKTIYSNYYLQEKKFFLKNLEETCRS